MIQLGRNFMINIDWGSIAYVISVTTTVAFAVTAVLAIRNDSDIDIGGGTIRDVILGVPVFWSLDLIYVQVAVLSSIAALYGRKFFSHRYMFALMLYLDALGVAMFGIQATGKAWALGFGLPVAPVIMGVTTAIGGGLMRDMLAGRVTLLMRQEIYATPVLMGCTLYVLILQYLPDHHIAGALVCIMGSFALRSAAIYWDLSMPAFARMRR
jgi:uncharacterized membrane protein YeiH